MSATPRPTLESSAALRALVRVKYARGQSTEAMILARLGGQAVKQKQASRLPDGISRLALQQYVELMPNDLEVKQTLPIRLVHPLFASGYMQKGEDDNPTGHRIVRDKLVQLHLRRYPRRLRTKSWDKSVD